MKKVTFLNHEKSNYVNKTMNKLQTSSGQILEDQNKMKLRISINSYIILQMLKHRRTGTYPTLTETESNNLDRPIDYAEIIKKTLKKQEY